MGRATRDTAGEYRWRTLLGQDAIASTRQGTVAPCKRAGSSGSIAEGTFTDCLGVDLSLRPEERLIRTAKVLSSDRAPILGMRQLLGLERDEPIPPCDVRMGTTIATNALLERRGARTALVITRGFRDLLAIGNQTRPDIFALDIKRPEHLYERVIETEARGDANGTCRTSLDRERLRQSLEDAHRSGIRSLAVVVLHAYANGELEREIGALAAEVGFSQLALSHQVTAEMGMVGRGDTTVVDAYLTPLIRDYVAALLAELPGSSLRIMQSSGGLTDASRFRGKNAVLSGPAGGVVAFAHVARAAGHARAIGFDMGGTSTDVSAFDGEFEREYETEIAGVRLRAPMMAIHTVAAGGGSICRYHGGRFIVGPDSAGAVPGPLCYGREDAHELTITDVNLILGRLVGDRFPLPLDATAAERALEAITARIGADSSHGHYDDRFRVAAGFFEVANANMAEAIRQVSIARGRDVREYALVVFGGAGGQHACPIARQLGIRTLIVDRFAGVLSAYGMGLADVSWDGEADAGQAPLEAGLELDFSALEARATRAMADEGFDPGSTRLIRRADVRYRGTDTPLAIELPETGAAGLREAFEAEHRTLYGYVRRQELVEVTTLRIEARAHLQTPPSSPWPSGDDAQPSRTARMWTDGGFRDVAVYPREVLPAHATLEGPALILDDTGTIAIDQGWQLQVDDAGRLIMRDTQPSVADPPNDETIVDPVRLEIFNNVFMSIAAQMGNALQRTAVSTNIRERLDFSCALFDAKGNLVANAPHIPVHLGAMGESIKGVLARYPEPERGAVYAVNDPAMGGSHLPDVTVIAPVHQDDGTLAFFTASRGHHADIGGITPGSMPPFSRCLADEGVVFRGLPIVCDHRFDESAVMAALSGAVHPARDPRSNILDLQAQVAACTTGARLLKRLVERYGRATVAAYMGHVRANAAAQVAAEIAAVRDGRYRFTDALDDGTVIAVTIIVRGERMSFDFTGTGGASSGNLNAPRAVTIAAVIYVLRTLVGAPIPLNSGCLQPVDIYIPDNTILSPPAGSAVVGGNVETSQRVVDVLLGALGKAAASQGTMNNLTFGTEKFGYYETIAGGAGATANAPGASAVHTHMTNTRITDPEVLEARFPVRLLEFSLRPGSGGAGAHKGGDGVVRELELLEPMRISILSERRSRAPFGLAGGGPGAVGRNLRNGQELAGKVTLEGVAGDRVRLETPGGGGWGTGP